MPFTIRPLPLTVHLPNQGNAGRVAWAEHVNKRPAFRREANACYSPFVPVLQTPVWKRQQWQEPIQTFLTFHLLQRGEGKPSFTAHNFLTHPPTGTPRRAMSPGEGLPFFPLCLGEAARLSITARIGRAQFLRARSASKKDSLAAPYPPLFREQEDD